MPDPLIIAGREFGSRLFLGTAGYPNRMLMLNAIAASRTEMRRLRSGASASRARTKACSIHPEAHPFPSEYSGLSDREIPGTDRRARARGARNHPRSLSRVKPVRAA